MSPTEEGKLTKVEMETLLEAKKEGELRPEKAEQIHRIQAYDFQQPSRFNKSELDHLKAMHDELARQASPVASRLLRTTVKVQMVNMDHMKWENLVQEAGESALSYAFTLHPLDQRGIISMDRQLSMCCLERLLGGRVSTDENVGSFSDLDASILASFLGALLAPLPESWQKIGEFELQIGALVQELRSLELFPPDEDMFQVSFLLQGNVGSGQIALAVPFEAVRFLPPDEEGGGHAFAASGEAARSWLEESLRRVPAELTVLLGTTDVKVNRIVRMEPGDVIVLDKNIADMVDVRVNDRVKLRGFLGSSRGKLAVQLANEG